MKNRKFRTLYTAIKDNQITPQEAFWDRRAFLKNLGLTMVSGSTLLPRITLSATDSRSVFTTSEPLSSEYVVTHHNNFYEFSTSKSKPAKLASKFKPGNDWKVAISGLVAKPGEYTLEDILSWSPQEERIYRLRCVEGWSMVIPWQGFPLSDLIKRVQPSAKARFVEFKTLESRSTFPGQKRGSLGFHVLPWPRLCENDRPRS